MSAALLSRRPDLFERCLIASLVLHAVFFLLARLAPRSIAPGIEIDLTTSILGGSGPAKLGAPKRLVPKAVGPALPAESISDLKPVPQAPKDWVLPGPKTQTVEKPPETVATPGGAIEGTGTAAKTGGSGAGSDDGVPGGTGSGGSGLLALPRLLNRDEMLANLRRFYPESERRAGREGRVVLELHIGVDGLVAPGNVVTSSGAAFDEAAKKVARLMRFSPALARSGPVAVKALQSMVFELHDD